MAIFAAILFFAMLPHGWAIRFDERGAKDGGVALRYRLASWWGMWATVLFWLFRRILNVRFILKMDPAAATLLRTQPCLVIANHQSTLDALIHPSLCWSAGCDNIRGVFKMELFKAWFFGSFFRISGSVGVARGGDPNDFTRMREGAARARRENASFIIYPEGTRSTDGNLRDPKIGGVMILLKKMKVPIITVMSSWDIYPKAKTIFHGAAYYGRTLTITIRPPVRLHGSRNQLRGWITGEWERMAEELKQQTDT
jgi:1-acyl-sn-glycerol-3-phosphate acyltransferase